MNRSLIIHSTLLTASLVGAYLVWTREPDSGKEEEISILGFHAIDRVTFEEPQKKVSIERKKDKQGTYYWVRIETQQQKKSRARKKHQAKAPPKADTDAAAPSAAGVKPAATAAAAPATTAAKAASGAPAARNTVPAVKNPGQKGPASLAQDPKADPDQPSHNPKRAATAAGGLEAESGARKAPSAPAAGASPAPAAGASPAPAAGASPAPPAAPGPAEVKTKIKVFVANTFAEEMFKALAHLSAARVLGTPSNDKLEEFGLSSSKAVLTVTSGPTTRRFRVGDRTYGNLDYYLQDMSDQRVYVVRQELVEQIKNARSRLYTANLHTFTLSDIARVIVAGKDKKATLWQHDREKPGGAYWTDAEDAPAKQGNDTYRNWVGKVDALRVKEYTEPAQKPEGLTELLRIDYYKGGDALGFLLLYRKNESSIASAPAASSSQESYYALTEHTRVPVELYRPRAEEVVKGLPEVLKE